MAKVERTVERKGRGRPVREPALLPAGYNYATWSRGWAPQLERLLRLLEAEQVTWNKHETQCKAAQKARASGLAVSDPPAPRLLFRSVRELAKAPPKDRAAIVDMTARLRVPMPVGPSVRTEQIAVWLLTEALARGLACDFDTAYQLWFIFADLLLRDSEIGAVIARVHANLVDTRSPRLSAKDVRALDCDLAVKERKRVRSKLVAFGYKAA